MRQLPFCPLPGGAGADRVVEVILAAATATRADLIIADALKHGGYSNTAGTSRLPGIARDPHRMLTA
jgi:hypothetical protein